MRLLFFDIETTGFSSQYDFVIELAGVIYNTETKEKEATFHEYVKPGKRIPIHITEITGITNDMVKNARSEREVIESFVNFIQEQQPDQYVGHNLDAFDLRWMKDKSQFYELVFPEKDTTDTLKMAREKKVPTTMVTKTGRPSYRQEGIAEAYGIVYDAHSAIADVLALIEIWTRMTDGDETPTRKANTDRRRALAGF